MTPQNTTALERASVYKLVNIVRSLDKTGDNLVRLHYIRKAMSQVGMGDRTVQDNVIHTARRLRLVSLAANEGRHGLAEEDRAAAIVEDGTIHTFLMVRN